MGCDWGFNYSSKHSTEQIRKKQLFTVLQLHGHTDFLNNFLEGKWDLNRGDNETWPNNIVNLLELVTSVRGSSMLKTTWRTNCFNCNSSNGNGGSNGPRPPLLNPHTPQLNKVLITPHSFLSKCLPNHKRVTGLEAGLASTTAGAWCTGKHGGPEALIKTAMTPLRHTHVHSLYIYIYIFFFSPLSLFLSLFHTSQV